MTSYTIDLDGEVVASSHDRFEAQRIYRLLCTTTKPTVTVTITTMRGGSLMSMVSAEGNPS